MQCCPLTPCFIARLKQSRVLTAVAVLLSFSIGGCDKVESIVDDVKSQVSDTTEPDATAPETAQPATTPATPAP